MTNRIVRILALAAILVSAAALAGRATAGHTPDPAGVTVAGSLQSELGCPGDWQPGCASTHLQDDPGDDVWQGVFNVPGGTWDYKAALNDSWDENYGANGVPDGANITLNAPGGDVKFYYDHKSHWITDSVSSRIVTAAGNFQSELGCPGDWQPDCLRSWLQDVDGDGTYTFVTTGLPAGNYGSKAAIAEGWAESYPPSNLTFSVPNDCSTTTFSFVSSTNTFAANSIAGQCGHGQDNNVEYFGLGHNSHDTLYRVPFGSVTPGTEVILRFRTYHNDVTGVRARVWDQFYGRDQSISVSSDRFDVARVHGVVAEALAQHQQALRQVLRRYDATRAPDSRDELVMGDEIRRGFYQHTQDLERESRQPDQVGVTPESSLARVEREVGKPIALK